MMLQSDLEQLSVSALTGLSTKARKYPNQNMKYDLMKMKNEKNRSENRK